VPQTCANQAANQHPNQTIPHKLGWLSSSFRFTRGKEGTCKSANHYYDPIQSYRKRTNKKFLWHGCEFYLKIRPTDQESWIFIPGLVSHIENPLKSSQICEHGNDSYPDKWEAQDQCRNQYEISFNPG
jgi:hypothetical protein